MGHHRDAKRTVEQCLRFDISWLRQTLNRVASPANQGDLVGSGWFTFRDASGRIKAALGLQVGRIEGEGLLVLTDPERASLYPSVRLLAEYEIPIAVTRPRIGGVRYWFRCPVEHDGKPCGRRVKHLLLPPGGEIFGCRRCHDLTYKSSQKHDNRAAKLARDPAAMDAALNSKDLRRACLGVDALALYAREVRKQCG